MIKIDYKRLNERIRKEKNSPKHNRLLIILRIEKDGDKFINRVKSSIE